MKIGAFASELATPPNRKRQVYKEKKVVISRHFNQVRKADQQDNDPDSMTITLKGLKTWSKTQILKTIRESLPDNHDRSFRWLRVCSSRGFPYGLPFDIFEGEPKDLLMITIPTAPYDPSAFKPPWIGNVVFREKKSVVVDATQEEHRRSTWENVTMYGYYDVPYGSSGLKYGVPARLVVGANYGDIIQYGQKPTDEGSYGDKRSGHVSVYAMIDEYGNPQRMTRREAIDWQQSQLEDGPPSERPMSKEEMADKIGAFGNRHEGIPWSDDDLPF